MARLDDIQLQALLDDLESDRVERKEAWTGDVPERAAQAVCAFANDMPDHRVPGVLLIGARDDGTLTGLQVTDQLLQTLAGLRSNGNIVPPPRLTVEHRKLKGADLAVVTVWPAIAPPVRLRGRIWIRVGPRRATATAHEESILSERRRHRDLPFDVHPLASCPFDELNQTEFEGAYLPNAVAPDVLSANERSFRQRLAVLRMIASVDDPTPTVLGVLTIGKSPRTWIQCAYIQFLKINGVNLEDPIVDAEDIDGSLATMLRRLDEKLKAHLTLSINITDDDTERRTVAYSLSALQQLTRNAVMHRTYENTNAPIRIYWFNDRIEIHSPGGPFGIVTAANFGQPGIADYRNPHIAEAMKVLGYVQRFGVGIATARSELAANGNPLPQFVIETTTVLAIIRRAT